MSRSVGGTDAAVAAYMDVLAAVLQGEDRFQPILRSELQHQLRNLN